MFETHSSFAQLQLNRVGCWCKTANEPLKLSLWDLVSGSLFLQTLQTQISFCQWHKFVCLLKSNKNSMQIYADLQYPTGKSTDGGNVFIHELVLILCFYDQGWTKSGCQSSPVSSGCPAAAQSSRSDQCDESDCSSFHLLPNPLLSSVCWAQGLCLH